METSGPPDDRIMKHAIAHRNTMHKGSECRCSLCHHAWWAAGWNCDISTIYTLSGKAYQLVSVTRESLTRDLQTSRKRDTDAPGASLIYPGMLLRKGSLLYIQRTSGVSLGSAWDLPSQLRPAEYLWRGWGPAYSDDFGFCCEGIIVPRMPYEYYDRDSVVTLEERNLCIGIDGSVIEVGIQINPSTGKETTSTPVYHIGRNYFWERLEGLGNPVRMYVMYESGYEGISWCFPVSAPERVVFIHDLISALPWAPVCRRVCAVQRRWRDQWRRRVHVARAIQRLWRLRRRAAKRPRQK